MKSVVNTFYISKRAVFLFAICVLICFTHFLLITQLLSYSSDENQISSLRLSSLFENTKLICKTKLSCPNNIQHFSIHINQNAKYTNVTYIRSPIFNIILETIRNSSYYTTNSTLACIHISPVDTIDRDRRSKNGYYLYFIEQRLHFFPEWSNPNLIHLIFNHYTGTWPTYQRTLDFSLPSKYILASTSFTYDNYNCSTDITFPLFHNDYPSNHTDKLLSIRKFLLSFKGKSYEDVQHHRTFFRHLNNNRDIIIRYTDNITRSNHRNDDIQYNELLRQSYFCLVPSGRRLYSYRFLETLQYGCIPVITSNDNESIILPFSEIVDWSKSVFIYKNLPLTLLPYYLRMIDSKKRYEMQKQCVKIWFKYFSSIERITLTLLDILNDRFTSAF